ncbi:S1 RNA-binding domain-containing protein [Actinomycetota bacterium Odt1-20B]
MNDHHDDDHDTHDAHYKELRDRLSDQPEASLGGVARGQIRRGVVTVIAPFGAFVELHGTDLDFSAGSPVQALVRIPEITWAHISHPSDVLAVGDEISAEVLHVDAERGQISLSTKALEPKPQE